MNKLFQIVAWLTILGALGLMGLLAYWLLFPYKLVTFDRETYPIMNENKTVKQGGLLTYHADYCKYTTLAPKIYRTYEDGLVFVVPEVATSRESGCHEIDVNIIVPRSLPVGVYKLQTIYVYKVNPVREVSLTVNTDKFTVVK
jgi:hypothetical protein